MSSGLVMPSSHLILCWPLPLLPSIFPSIRVFSNESALHIRWPKYWSIWTFRFLLISCFEKWCCDKSICIVRFGFPGGTGGKESSSKAGDLRDAASIPGWGRSPGGRHGNPLQYSCLENPMDRGACWATVHGVAKSQTQQKHLSRRA